MKFVQRLLISIQHSKFQLLLKSVLISLGCIMLQYLVPSLFRAWSPVHFISLQKNEYQGFPDVDKDCRLPSKACSGHTTPSAESDVD